jgi:hypothetical protein
LGREHGASGKRCRFCVRTLTRWPCWPIYSETHPVAANEILLRSVPNVGGNVVNGKVQDAAFQPRNHIDEDGLSFYRMDFITPEQLAENNTHRAGVFYAYLNASGLLEMNLTLKPSPDELPGHLVIPEMTYAAYSARDKKVSVKDFMIFMKLHANKRPLWGPSRPRGIT